jgi:hypothetical protein
MDIASLIKAVFDPQLNRCAWVQEIIKPGDVFRLTVIDVKDNQHALVDLGKFRAMAEVKFPVQAGAELLVKVTDAGGQLRLQLIDPDSGALSSSKEDHSQLKILSFELFDRIQSDIRQTAHHILNLPDEQLPPEHIRRALATLDAHFATIDLGRNLQRWLPLLKSTIEDGGLFFEKKVADIVRQLAGGAESELAAKLMQSSGIKKLLAQDLKPALLMLREYLETPDSISKFLNSKNFSSFKGALDMLLADIGSQHSRAVQRHDLPDPHQVFSFVIPLKENRKKAWLKLYCPKKKRNGSREEFRISLLLDLDRLGEIRTDLALIKMDLCVTFFVKNDTSKKRLDDGFAELHQSLKSLFDYLILKTVVSEKKIQDFHHEDLDPGDDRQIDLRI